MKKNIIFLILIISISCKPSPTYNAFDKEFDISLNQVINDGCDTISAGCGYFNFRQKKGRLKNYYQVYIDDWNEVVAKGFDYSLDTLICKSEEEIEVKRYAKISRKNIVELNLELKKFGFIYNRQKKSEFGYDRIEIVNSNLKDTIVLSLVYFTEPNNDSLIYRELSYFKGKK